MKPPQGRGLATFLVRPPHAVRKRWFMPMSLTEPAAAGGSRRRHLSLVSREPSSVLSGPRNGQVLPFVPRHHGLAASELHPVSDGEVIAPQSLNIPDELRLQDLLCVVSLSGGKDSTATAIALRDADIPARYVFADTGWEAPETYTHLELLRSRLGPIEVVGVPGGMREKIRQRAGFPTRLARWCTSELKVKPIQAFHEELRRTTGKDTVNVVGVRADESPSRSLLTSWEDDPDWGGFVWRPILNWKVRDVLAAHIRAGIPIHPLYRRGHNRVGCWPCIFASKEELRLLAVHNPERIEELAELEATCTALRASRNQETPGRYAHAQATFFQARLGSAPMSIKDIIAWSMTSRGGRQLQLLPEPPSGGCFRWGLCDLPEAA